MYWLRLFENINVTTYDPGEVLYHFIYEVQPYVGPGFLNEWGYYEDAY